jgi:uncharacterized protein (TIGR02453 family)
VEDAVDRRADMIVAASSAFTGFRPEAIQFLVELAANNHRAWFQPRKADYEALLKQPLEAFVAALGERFEARGIPLHADPARSPFRIYRDVRFSKDKSPYKTNVAASFPFGERDGSGGSGGHADDDPGGYFHLAPGEVFVGGGIYHPATSTLNAWRRAVVDDPDLKRLLTTPAFTKQYGLMSPEDGLKRVPTGFPADHPDAELLKLRHLTFGHRLADADVMSPRLVDVVADSFAVAAPVMRYLARLGR